MWPIHNHFGVQKLIGRKNVVLVQTEKNLVNIWYILYCKMLWDLC